MQLQLVDKKLAKPLGILENVTLSSCGIKYEHNFAIVDFGTIDPNYEVILGRPFMRQLMAIQDWGYNYLYLRHDGVTTRVNLSTHEFRDVAKLPVANFESATTSRDDKTSVGDEGENHFWLFEAETLLIKLPSQTSRSKNSRIWDRSSSRWMKGMLHKSGCIY